LITSTNHIEEEPAETNVVSKGNLIQIRLGGISDIGAGVGSKRTHSNMSR